MREPISLKEILAILIKKGTLILCLAVILAVVAGVYQLNKQLELASDPANSAEAIQEVYADALKLYEEQNNTLNTTLENTQNKLEYQTEYNNNSVLMNLDPYHTAVNTTIIAITGVDEILMQEQYAQKELSPAYFTAIIQDLYRVYWESLVLEDALKNHAYEDVPEQYLRELICFNESESSTFTLTVYAETEKDAAQLGKAVCDQLMQMHQQVESNTYPHSLTVVNTTTKMDVVSDIEERQETGKTLAQEYLDTINSLQEQIKELEEPKMGVAFGKKTIAFNVLKWAVLGAIVGVVLACGWILVLFLMRSRVESSRQMEQVLGVAFLGSTAKRGGLWNRLANRLLGERTWKDAAQASAFITEGVKTCLEDAEQVAVVTTLNIKAVDAAVKQAADAAAAACGKVSCVKNAEKNPETIALFRSCKYVILAERIGLSEVPEMLAVLELAKRMDVKVIGFVTV